MAWCIKGTDESSLVLDSLVPFMNHVSDLGSLIMIQITPEERTQKVTIIDFRNSKQKDNSKTTEFNVQGSSRWYHMTLNTRIFEVFLLWALYQQWNVNIVVHKLGKPKHYFIPYFVLSSNLFQCWQIKDIHVQRHQHYIPKTILET